MRFSYYSQVFFKVVLYEFTSMCIYSYMDNKQRPNAYYMYCESQFGTANVVFEVLVLLACLVANY